MSWSLPLLRVRGIDVKVHLSFVVILVWAAFSWGSGMDAGLEGAVYGIVATLLLFACVTLHELGHAVAAQHYGIAVQDITLLPIGGVARIEVPQNPKQELAIALAGPAVNVAIAALLLLAGAVLQATSIATPARVMDAMGESQWGDLLPYLTVANIGLVFFNAIPAFPLDGGRVLRALLALRTEYGRATRIAASLGQGLAVLFGLAGVASGDVILIVIASVVWFGAAAEAQQVAAGDEARGGATVGRGMVRQPHAPEPRPT
jgi:stage IV sporulation protein FB